MDVDDARIAEMPYLLHHQIDGAVVDSGAESGPTGGPVGVVIVSHSLHGPGLEIELVGSDPVFLGVLGYFTGVLIGFQHVGQVGVHMAVLVDHIPPRREGLVERHHIGPGYHFLEGLGSEPGGGCLDPPGGYTGSGRGP